MKKFYLSLLVFFVICNVIKAEWEIKKIYDSKLLAYVSKLPDNRFTIISNINDFLISDNKQDNWKSIFFNDYNDVRCYLILDEENVLISDKGIYNLYNTKFFKLNINTAEREEFINYNNEQEQVFIYGISKIPSKNELLTCGNLGEAQDYLPVVFIEDTINKKREKIVFENYKNEGFVYTLALSESVYVGLSISKQDISAPTGRILRTEDGGKTWSETFFAKNIQAQHLKFYDSKIGFIVGNEGVLYKTDDGGKTWSNIYNATSFEHKHYSFVDAYFLDKDRIVLVGADKVTNEGFICYSKNGGIDWNIIYRTSKGSLLTVSMIDSTVYAFGRNGIMVKGVLNDSSGITEFQTSANIQIYPNPTFSSCRISGNIESLVNDFNISIYDINGNNVLEVCKENNLKGEYSYTFNTDILAIGMYNVVIDSDGKKQIEKLVISR